MGDIYVNTQIQPMTDILGKFDKLIYKSVNITGTGTVNVNALQLIGSVKVINQWAIITSITTLTNMTNVYADLWDGTNSVKLTKTPGATLSNAPVGTFFTKDKVSAETYSVNMSNECRMLEALNKDAIPFVITQKNGTNTYVRFNFTTTDAPINFWMTIWFQYQTLDGGSVAFL